MKNYRQNSLKTTLQNAALTSTFQKTGILLLLLLVGPTFCHHLRPTAIIRQPLGTYCGHLLLVSSSKNLRLWFGLAIHYEIELKGKLMENKSILNLVEPPFCLWKALDQIGVLRFGVFPPKSIGQCLVHLI